MLCVRMSSTEIARARLRRVLFSCVLLGIAGSVGARPPVADERAAAIGDPNPSASLRRAPADTTFYGGIDAGGIAIEGGIWNFEDGTLQGWTSVDLTEIPVFGRRVEVPFIGAISTNSDGSPSTGSLWIGATEAEAAVGCWPGGLGYSNNWVQTAAKTLTYDGTDGVALEFDYFVDSETQFDFTYVYVNQQGVSSDPLNTSAWPNPDTGLGYSGGDFDGTGIGSPTDPAHDVIAIDDMAFPFGAGEYELQFVFDSDPLFSDGIDSFAGYWDTIYGPFGADVITVDGVNEGDFESGTDGWEFRTAPGVGTFMAVEDLADLDPIPDLCPCPITEGANLYVLIGADLSGGEPHPEGQHEELTSNPIYVGDNADPTAGVLFSVFEDTPLSDGVGYRVNAHYYPWTCPTTGVVGWTVRPAAPTSPWPSGFLRCRSIVRDLSSFIPSDADSVKVVIELLTRCIEMEFGECTPENRNDSPYWDDIRYFTVAQPTAPALALDLLFNDRFATHNTLFPWFPVDAKAYYDINRSDGDDTNADMGDSAVVYAGTDPGTRVFFNFRVYPGPYTDTSDPFFSRYGGGFIADGIEPDPFAKARMDTAEVVSGPVAGGYATYLHEADGGVEGSADYKLIADQVLTPGTTVEYFFTADFGAGEPVSVSPDTTDGFFLEWEALPGWFEVFEDVLAPCMLYVDAFNAGAQVPIEAFGLAPFLGSITDVNGLRHNGWDRYDYLGAASNVPAPMAREQNGDNGMTKFQSLFYETILYNTGSNSLEGLRDGDADLLVNWLTTSDLGRWGVTAGLWLSGDGIARILDRPGRPSSQLLLSGFVSAELVCESYGAPGCGEDAESACVRLDPSPGADFGTPVSYAAAGKGGGCPAPFGFDVVAPLTDGAGNLEYVNQDETGQPVTQYASVSNDQLSETNPFGVVLDGFSLHGLRRVPPDFSGGTEPECGTDSTAITTRVEDVLIWFGIPPSVNVCTTVIVDVDSPPGAPPARTVLFQNTPNPFNPLTRVRYDLAADAHVVLRVFDVGGKLVRTLVDQPQAAESYEVVWDGLTDSGERASSGVYWVRMTTSRGFKASTKVVMLR